MWHTSNLYYHIFQEKWPYRISEYKTGCIRNLNHHISYEKRIRRGYNFKKVNHMLALEFQPNQILNLTPYIWWPLYIPLIKNSAAFVFLLTLLAENSSKSNQILNLHYIWWPLYISLIKNSATLVFLLTLLAENSSAPSITFLSEKCSPLKISHIPRPCYCIL